MSHGGEVCTYPDDPGCALATDGISTNNHVVDLRDLAASVARTPAAEIADEEWAEGVMARVAAAAEELPRTPPASARQLVSPNV